jgi:uncharacterized integral membrane protein
MGRIILSIIFIIIIVVFVSFNVKNTTSLSLFGKPVEEVSVVSVALISFVIGILYSFIFYVSSYFSKMRKGRLKAQEQLTKIKGREIKEKEKKLEKAVAGKPAPPTAKSTDKGDKGGGITSVFSKRKKPREQGTSEQKPATKK